LERLWRSLKERLGLPSFKPATRAALERRIERTLLYYAYLRPHQGLGGATPAEVYFGIEPAHLSAVHPPRGRRGERSEMSSPFLIAHLDREKRLPVLLRQAA
jgi:hypothetical protein